MEAAVATGSSAIPVKLPSPEAGTAEQAVPNGMATAGAGDMGAWVAGAAAVDAGVASVPPPHAADRQRAPARTGRVSRVFLMMIFLRVGSD
ncbi:hypothetical protein Psi02_32730 [Planotetraspora silvatica]|uniref:Uncharacterized protein n=1 Tax=Planotetraspora silvatica TaxID=234614 RepID=A0A8J3XMT7_9ACTN|nr:hypothetical protein Psi02_32730 [Planotetraspora silvatica]